MGKQKVYWVFVMFAAGIFSIHTRKLVQLSSQAPVNQMVAACGSGCGGATCE